MSRTKSRAATSSARPSKADLEAARARRLKDVIAPRLEVLFCGINPGLYSAATGNHFARPGNRFWPALHAAGFTSRLLHPCEKEELLKSGFGLTNLVARASASADELGPAEFVAGRTRLARKVRRYRPRVVAFLGLGAYRHAFGRPKATLGLQPDTFQGARVWVLPSPSGLNANYQMPALVKLFRSLWQQKKSKTPDLHGSAPDECRVALLVIDMINAFDFDGAQAMLPRALAAARATAALKQRARKAGVPVVYVNDNFGRWRSDFRNLLEHCLGDGVRGKPIAELLKPDQDDYFVLKPKHSGFQFTALDVLLEHLGAETLILTGVAGNFCVLFTAHDAYMRDYHLVVPGDCVASQTEDEDRHALAHMAKVTKADTRPSSRIDFAQLQRD